MLKCQIRLHVFFTYLTTAISMIVHVYIVLLPNCLVSMSNSLIVSPVRSTYGEYYGLVVVTPPRPPPPRPCPQTLHRSHDNLKNPYRIASIFYMQIDIGERIAGKQDGPSLIIYGPPRPPRIAQNAPFFTLGPIYEKLVIIFFPCYKFVCSVMRSYCPEIFVHLGST